MVCIWIADKYIERLLATRKLLKLNHFRVLSKHFVAELTSVSDMAATMACSSTHMLHNAPVALSRTSGQPATSSTSILHFRKPLASNLSIKISRHQISKRGVLQVRASTNGDNISELASEKAVETGKELADDASKLANGENPAAFDDKADDASDAASYNSDVREKVVDIASDMAVDPSDVDTLAKKDAEPLAHQSGRSIEDTAEALESKAAEVSDREARKAS